MVDGEATAPQGPAASGMAISQLGFPVVQVRWGGGGGAPMARHQMTPPLPVPQPRLGTSYASVTAGQDAAQQQSISATTALAAGRPSTSVSPLRPSTSTGGAAGTPGRHAGGSPRRRRY